MSYDEFISEWWQNPTGFGSKSNWLWSKSDQLALIKIWLALVKIWLALVKTQLGWETRNQSIVGKQVEKDESWWVHILNDDKVYCTQLKVFHNTKHLSAFLELTKPGTSLTELPCLIRETISSWVNKCQISRMETELCMTFPIHSLPSWSYSASDTFTSPHQTQTDSSSYFKSPLQESIRNQQHKTGLDFCPPSTQM